MIASSIPSNSESSGMPQSVAQLINDEESESDKEGEEEESKEEIS